MERDLDRHHDLLGGRAYNVLTGDDTGTVHEVFRGKASDGTTGTLTFTEQATIVGATSTLHIVATILSGTGGFAGSTGTAIFAGTDNILTGSGSYTGTWHTPDAAPVTTSATKPQAKSKPKPKPKSHKHHKKTKHRKHPAKR